MKKAHTHVTTSKPAQEVYDYLVDFTRHPEWRFDVLASELIGGQPGQPGARYRQRVKPGRKEMTTEVEVTKADPSRAVAFKTVDSGPVSAAGEWTIGSQGGETEIVYHGTIEAHGLLRLFEPFMGPTLNKTARRYEQALADRLSA